MTCLSFSIFNSPLSIKKKMCEFEKNGKCDVTEKVNEIYNAIMGSGMHKGDGIIDRLIKLEEFKSKVNYKIAFASGVSAFLGLIVGYLVKMLISR